jgi:hypothetical protein
MRRLNIDIILPRLQYLHPSLSFTSIEKILNNRQEIYYTCNICGNKGSKILYSLLQGTGCKYCGIKARSDKVKLTEHEIILRFEEVHGTGTYDYSHLGYKNTNTLVTIRCPRHNIGFKQAIRKHLAGHGCPECAKDKAKLPKIYHEEYVARSRNKHGLKYEYVENFKGTAIPISILCPEHGIFKQSPNSHWLGRGCPECGKKTMGRRKWTAEKFENTAKEIHSNKYSYSLTGFSSLQSYITITCPEHGAFRQIAKLHITKRNPQGCPKCGQVISNDKRRTPVENIIHQAVSIHGNRYDYSRINYRTMLEPVEIICPKHGSFYQRMSDHLYNKCGCPSCYNFVSKGEDEVAEWIKSLGYEVERNNRSFLSGRELDIYIPEKRTAIEYCGLYHHSTAFKKDKLYHLNKLLLCQDIGIRLIQIWDAEWLRRQTACKDIISFALGKINKRVYARQCIIQKTSVQESNTFLEINHIQGKCSADYRIGLFLDGILIGVQCYTENIQRKWTLARTAFIGGCQVIGGISRMFKFFAAENNPDEVIDYTDRRLFIASGHRQMGFTQECITPPGNNLTDGRNLFSRRHYRHWGKRHFKYKMPWDDALTDTENLANNGWFWVWDCGKIKNVWTKPTISDFSKKEFLCGNY